jgi:hypothetical protein
MTTLLCDFTKDLFQRYQTAMYRINLQLIFDRQQMWYFMTLHCIEFYQFVQILLLGFHQGTRECINRASRISDYYVQLLYLAVMLLNKLLETHLVVVFIKSAWQNFHFHMECIHCIGVLCQITVPISGKYWTCIATTCLLFVASCYA